MKHLLALVFILTPLLAFAQTWSDSLKQEFTLEN